MCDERGEFRVLIRRLPSNTFPDPHPAPYQSALQYFSVSLTACWTPPLPIRSRGVEAFLWSAAFRIATQSAPPPG